MGTSLNQFACAMGKVPSSAERSSQLDMLRAAAVLMVVSFHLVQMSPVPFPELMRFASVGAYGVDLFFVLSGWLIGNLYWKEHSRFGNVQLLRFWSRRWIRTIPPYFVALALSWLAVKVERREPFDWGYLLFLQNYYEKIPFFLVSWSLCIEEHFYLFMPLLLLLISRSRVSVLFVFAVLILAAPIWRCSFPYGEMAKSFGYWTTATHLRLEGLLLGFGAAYLINMKPDFWKKVLKSSIAVVTICALCLGGLVFLPEKWMYRIGFTALAFGMSGLLIFLTNRKPGAIASSSFVKWVALASYSIYLTHPLMLHIARRISGATPVAHTLTYFLSAIALVAVAGAGFYFAVERTSIQVRDRWVPRRSRNQVLTPNSEPRPLAPASMS